jgi:hypothetical protein
MHSLARGDHSPHTTVQCVFGGASFGRCGRRKQVQLGFFGYSTNSFARPSRAGPARLRCLVAFSFRWFWGFGVFFFFFFLRGGLFLVPGNKAAQLHICE